MNHELRIRNQGQRTVLCRGKGLSFAYCALMFFCFLAFLIAVPVAQAGCCLSTTGCITQSAGSVEECDAAGAGGGYAADGICRDRVSCGLVSSTEQESAIKNLQGAEKLVNIFGRRVGFSTTTDEPQPEILVGKIIQGLMLLIGVIFGILVIYGGYMWMIARGNEEYVKKAINILQTAVIGLIIVVAAYAITNYVIDVVISSTFTD